MSTLSISRSVFSDNGTLEDISVKMNDFNSGTFVMPYVNGEDYLYIASDFPFNHRYIEVETANTQAAAIAISVWDGDSWVAAEDIIDQTSVGGIPLSQSGHISFRPDEDDGWSREDTNDEADQITGLTAIKIFSMYWARFSWSADLDATTELKFIGHRFSNDADLELEYPLLLRPNVLDQFKTGKTTWDLQHYVAAERIIRDLKMKSLNFSRNQILDWEIFTEASVHKVAEIAYSAFGKDFVDEKTAAHNAYKAAIGNLKLYRFDQTNDGILGVGERVSRQGILKR